MRHSRLGRTLSADVAAATVLTLLALASLPAHARADTAAGPLACAAAVDDGQSRGLPPSPGPTNPDGAD
jgi:hypothetical protein